MHRPMETSVLGVRERSDIVAVTKNSIVWFGYIRDPLLHASPFGPNDLISD